jgi:hypothetical protein
MILVNAFFLALYLTWNWFEYSALTRIYHVVLSPQFPWGIQISGSTQNGYGLIADFDANLGLIILLLATVINLYLAFRLQRNGEKKQ